MKSPILKANMNGFYVSESNNFPHSLGQFDCINDTPCDDSLGFTMPSWSDITNAIGDTAEKLAQDALAAGQKALIKEGQQFVNNTLGVTPTNVTQVTGPTPPPIVNTTYIDQPMDKNLKIALIAGGSLVGVLLLVTVIKGITK